MALLSGCAEAPCTCQLTGLEAPHIHAVCARTAARQAALGHAPFPSFRAQARALAGACLRRQVWPDFIALVYYVWLVFVSTEEWQLRPGASRRKPAEGALLVPGAVAHAV